MASDPLIRIRSLTGFIPLVCELGGDPIPMLEKCHVSPELIEKGDAVVPHAAVIRLLELAAETLKCKDFGLRLSRLQTLDVLGPIAIIGRNSRTVRDAVIGVQKYMHAYAPGLLVTLAPDWNRPRERLVFDVAVDGLPYRRQYMDLKLGAADNILRSLCAHGFQAQQVHLRHFPSNGGQYYREFFHCPVSFGQPEYALVVRTEDLDQEINHSDPGLLSMAEAYLSTIGDLHPLDLPGQVRALIRRLLSTSHATLVIVAKHLCIQERTLQRRLAEHGTSFDELIEDARRDLADHLLVNTGMPLSQVARMLGYSEQSSFNRAFARWYQTSPLARRRELASPAIRGGASAKR